MRKCTKTVLRIEKISKSTLKATNGNPVKYLRRRETGINSMKTGIKSRKTIIKIDYFNNIVCGAMV